MGNYFGCGTKNLVISFYPVDVLTSYVSKYLKAHLNGVYQHSFLVITKDKILT